jgi:hypothetical protein
VSGGKLYQNKNGYAAGGDGYYSKAAAGMSNANGSVMAAKFRVGNGTNTLNIGAARFNYGDGSRYWNVAINEYFADVSDGGAWWGGQPQVDLKSVESVALFCGKGNDGMLFVNGRLAQDGTGKNTTASALTAIHFGDEITTAAKTPTSCGTT